ncbi:hypothetical protein [Corynebacterium alimapuense]|uniref:ESX-1 secretion-associated protein n=1 Tax=Corynebacterium alimapuense TaxID=1576874 RepID=A0A3M8K7K0_9CORY|nr:hypothetical protein [Corynebacterium alimapuense]RNE48849.1 hypothetical protein C5L39_06010 [Corynebacterium alimapuense]
MSGISLDHTAALAALEALAVEGKQQHQRHTAATPALLTSAVGRDFAAQGKAIAEMLERVHSRGRECIEAVQTTTQAAAEQVQVFRGVDVDFAEQLRGNP